ncbi:MAG: 16S rRNA (cytidine(1402)-2'-O)-methyltransferase [Clostridia bacterium]|nr:16S rRNA (cytidine(1402)-2'-O)-methyltransferase [Clostridia bacterium]
MQGELYIVATPIGNLEDITLRAIRILKEVDIIAAEDTRHTLKLLNHLELSKPLISYHRHNEEIKTEELINKLLEGKNIALVSDAGTPVISDPGGEIVKSAIKNNIKVTPVPGACAAITALIASGIDAKEFTFIGFLPQNKKNRKEKLEQIKNAEITTILYEAPHKLLQTLQDLKQVLENRKIVLARELTKIHEEYITGTIEEIEKIIENPKGEYVIIIDKNQKTKKEVQLEELNKLSIEEHYEYYKQNGLEKKKIIKQIAKDRNVNKNEIYQKFLNI